MSGTQIGSNLPGWLIVRLKRQFGLAYFVETGTSSGETAELGAIAFERAWTIELFAGRLAKARERLAEYPNARILVGDSPTVLQALLPDLDKPTFFWLDAHYSGGPDVPRVECPLLEELRILGGFAENYAIVIDDARLFVSPPPVPHNASQWPTMGAIAEARPAGSYLAVIGDTLVITPALFVP